MLSAGAIGRKQPVDCHKMGGLFVDEPHADAQLFAVQAIAVAVVCASILLGANPALVQFLLCLPWGRLQRLSQGCALYARACP